MRKEVVSNDWTRPWHRQRTAHLNRQGKEKYTDMHDLPTNETRSTADVTTQRNMVNHPHHYNANPSGVEAIDVIEHMSFNVGSAMKYLWRADYKGTKMEDLKKAEWYVAREIQRLSKHK